jgi:hypothetical protein
MEWYLIMHRDNFSSACGSFKPLHRNGIICFSSFNTIRCTFVLSCICGSYIILTTNGCYSPKQYCPDGASNGDAFVLFYTGIKLINVICVNFGASKR